MASALAKNVASTCQDAAVMPALIEYKKHKTRRGCPGHLWASQRSSSMGTGGWSTARFTVETEEEADATVKNCTTDELLRV